MSDETGRGQVERGGEKSGEVGVGRSYYAFRQTTNAATSPTTTPDRREGA